jgi:hypothetical protein
MARVTSVPSIRGVRGSKPSNQCGEDEEDAVPGASYAMRESRFSIFGRMHAIPDLMHVHVQPALRPVYGGSLKAVR